VIKINLISAERRATKKKVVFDKTQQITAVCGCILVVTLAVVGWRVWGIHRDETRVDTQVADAQRETARLHAVLTQVQQFEQRKAQLQQRVTLIEQLRRDQIGPVHMLDQISVALPASVWLAELKQTPVPNEVIIDGRSLSLTGLSDFVANLERSGYFQRSVEIISSTTDTNGQGELIRFQIRAVFKTPGEPAATAADAKGAGAQLKPKG
jgi:type IV pilus assembly protein PilN